MQIFKLKLLKFDIKTRFRLSDVLQNVNTNYIIRKLLGDVIMTNTLISNCRFMHKTKTLPCSMLVFVPGS
jgi:hypothetical protein